MNTGKVKEKNNAWIPGSSPGMTNRRRIEVRRERILTFPFPFNLLPLASVFEPRSSNLVPAVKKGIRK